MKSSDTRVVRLIAFFKLLKAVLLVVVGVGALKLVHTNIASVVAEWVARLGLNPGGRYVGHAILKAATLSPNKMKELGIGSFIYAGLFLTEGTELWLVKRWAVWFSIIITSSLVPVELYHLYRHPTALRVLVLMINIAVVGFLFYRIRGERSDLG
jgi:uncharacterized membrane protein (DUF2068 family)